MEGKREEAKKWYRKAGNQNHFEAQEKLRAILEEEGDFKEAQKWWEKAHRKNRW